MVKRERLGGSEDESKVDRISMLPNEVLGLILSLLTMKEATAASILCRRWKYLWTLSSTLDLDGTQFLRRVNSGRCDELALERERREYGRWVDRIVACSSNRLLEFRVFFDLTRNHTQHIDEWLRFALSRKVERLELNLTDLASPEFRYCYECYRFPYKKGNFPEDLSFIKKLSTNNVNVSGEALELLLAKCAFLEQLSVSGSGRLKAVEIIGTFPSFKCLEINLCDHLDSLVIRDSDVVTLKYGRGRRIPNFELVNVPLLTQLWIQGRLTSSMKHVVEMFLPVLPQLHKFKIYYLSWGLSWNGTETFLSAVRMCNLKQLEVNVGRLHKDEDSLLPLINLIRASPCLRRFVVEAPHMHSKRQNLESGCATRKFLGVYPHLKEVEFVGYRGVNSQFELIMHFVENDVALENIVVDPRCFKLSLDRPWDRISRPKIKQEMAARAYAKEQLKKYVHPRINVKIL